MGVELAYTDAVARATDGLYAKVAKVIPQMEWPGPCPFDRRHQPPETGEERRHPGPQLHDARNFPLRQRFRRRQPGAGAGSGPHRCRRDCTGWGSFHGRDVQDSLTAKDRADPRRQGRLFTGRLHHRRRYPAAAPETSRLAGGELCEYLCRCEGGKRYLLHLGQRRGSSGRNRARFWHRYRHHGARPVSRPQCRGQDRHQGHYLGRRLRSA